MREGGRVRRASEAARSVRVRATVLATAVVAAALVLGAVALLATLRHSLTTSRDELSRAQLGVLVERAGSATLPARVDGLGDNTVAQVVLQSGRVLAASPGLLGAGPVVTDLPDRDQPVQLTLRGVPDDADTEDYRAWAMRTSTPSGPALVLVGSSLESASEASATLQRSLLVGVPVMLGLLAVSAYVLVGRALKPVEDIRADVAAIGDAELDRRIPVPPGADEVARLARTMNGMLDRLQGARDRQRTFVADASHELQSPLAVFRVQLEVALAHPDLAGWDRLAADLLDGSDTMERLVADLLFLARDDAAQHEVRRDLVDLDAVVLEEVARLRPRASVTLDATRVSAATTRGSANDLARLVRNVLENAAQHATSRVSVDLRPVGDEVRLAVADDGAGVPLAQRDRIFDRFARVEDVRTRRAGGTGLGLSIGQAIAHRHGGRIEVADDVPGGPAGAVFVVVLPTETAPSGAARVSRRP